ncbi:Gfo/Idh/MocA family oxidoreductase [Paenalkalicoccus suaedae]|uniref:Gfo/Idh/MocA family oxidoreductase n=1 Tax=Paenalkalicoccus suaedae TaxID=2592382 RepID=A0A859FCD1_9BACI|nr:Gfo/Idh/MocA family oxidoreductase [Paenalkalicoccus suaedae]QKS70600.1 Gfo/Idh/MocA family oxidoreductase [Paenalkalicoccus suaedae]
MSNITNWGILSGANIARSQLVPAIKEAHNATLVAVATRRDAEALKEEWGAEKGYGTYDELLNDSSIDAVYIPLPNALHKEWVIKALEKGKHVLVEKPAAISSADIEEMQEASERTGKLWMEAFMYRFHPQHAHVKQLIADKAIGEVKRIRSSFSFNMDLTKDDIRLDPSLGGGSLFDVGSYCVNVSRYLLDEEPIHVFAASRQVEGIKVDISTSALLTFSNVDVNLESSFDEVQVNRYEVIGTSGRIEVPFAFRPDQNPNNGKGEVFLRGADGSVLEYKTFSGNQYTLQVEHFSECIQTGATPSYTMEDTKNNMIVIERLYEASKSYSSK